MDRFRATSFTELFDAVKLINWSDFIGAQDAFPVKGTAFLLRFIQFLTASV